MSAFTICSLMEVRKIEQMGNSSFMRIKSMAGKSVGSRLSQLILLKTVSGLFRKVRRIDLMLLSKIMNVRVGLIP